MAVQKQDDHHEHTFSSCVRIRDVVLKTYLGRWTIGRSSERGSGISVLPAWYDDEDDDDYFIRLIWFGLLGFMAYQPLKVMLYSHLQHHNDATIIKTDTYRKTHEWKRWKTSLTIFLPLTLLQGFERVVQGLHVRGCWRLNINFIFWPHCYDHHVVSFLFS